MRIFSFGGGWQSVACLVLAATGKINFPTFVFANTGDDSEEPGTLDYIRDHALPYAQRHGIELLTVAKTGRTLYEESVCQEITSKPLPMRLPNGAPANRGCTREWKIRPISKFTKSRGASKKNPAVVGIGISLDEVQRAKDSLISHQTNEFPLLDLRIRRADCSGIISSAGLPVPPKSSCWFCPFKKLRNWQEMATDDPETFKKACEMETLINQKSKYPMYFTDRLVPLVEAVLPSDQMKLPLFDECTGYCWT